MTMSKISGLSVHRRLRCRWLVSDGAPPEFVRNTDTSGPKVQSFDWAGIPVKMQVDMGPPLLLITWPTFERHQTVWLKLRDLLLKLHCFLWRLLVHGQLQLEDALRNCTTESSLTVRACSGLNLCGCDLIGAFGLLEHQCSM